MLKKILQELILIKEALKDIQTNKRIVKEFAVKSCEDCQKENRMFEIIRILQWRGDGNYLPALSYDKNTKQILVNEDALMRAIQLANPGQAYRKIKLITHNDHKNLPIEYFGSDGTSRSEKNRRRTDQSRGCIGRDGQWNQNGRFHDGKIKASKHIDGKRIPRIYQPP